VNSETPPVSAPPAPDAPPQDQPTAVDPGLASRKYTSFNSPAADLNQLRNEAKRVAESAPSQPVHHAVLARARKLAATLEHDLGLPESPDGLSYADLAVLLSQSK
jgi:hypothetical protein